MAILTGLIPAAAVLESVEKIQRLQKQIAEERNVMVKNCRSYRVTVGIGEDMLDKINYQIATAAEKGETNFSIYTKNWPGDHKEYSRELDHQLRPHGWYVQKTRYYNTPQDDSELALDIAALPSNTKLE